MALGFVSWTLFNVFCVLLVVSVHGGAPWRAPGAGRGALVVDAPWTLHLPKLALGAVFQAALSLVLWTLLSDVPPISECEAVLAGGSGDPACVPSRKIEAFLRVFVTVLLLYVAAYVWYAWRAGKGIRRLPYAETRFARVLFGLAREQIGPVFLAFGGCTLLLLVVRPTSCWTYVESWLGVVSLV